MSATIRAKGVLPLLRAATVGLTMIAFSVPPALAFSLDSVRAKVARDYADVAHLAPARLEAMLASGSAPLLVDVRESEEYAVSHIAGAERVEPGSSVAQFLERYAEKARGRPVVFYCAVGVRSSILAGKVQAALKAAGAGPVYNLDGGIFGWHNEGRRLVDASGPTDFVHPYDRYWGRLLTRGSLARSTPATAAR